MNVSLGEISCHPDYSSDRLRGMIQEVEKGMMSFFREYANTASGRMLDPDFYKYTEQFLLRPSKRLRPLLFLLSYEVFNPEELVKDNHGLIAVAIALEILHAAILIHDDIIDEDEMRSQNLTLHKHFEYQNYSENGSCAALMLGDCLFSLGQLPVLMSAIEDDVKIKILTQLCKYTACTSEGQVDELFIASNHTIETVSEDQIVSAYASKMNPTAAELPIGLAAVASGVDEMTLKVVESFCKPIAIAFQILNDLVKHQKIQETRSRNSDFDGRRNTLLLKTAREMLTRKDQNQLDMYLAGAEAEARYIDNIMKIIADSGALEHMENEVERLFCLARKTVNESDLHQKLKERLLGLQGFIFDLVTPGSRYYNLNR